MEQILENSFDFSIRAMELIKYLDEEKRPFPLYEQFLASAMRVGIYLRLAASGGKSSRDSEQALFCIFETEYLLEIMAKARYLQEKQSHPIMDDCRALKVLIVKYLEGKK